MLVLLCKAEVDDIQICDILSTTNHEVVRLDVSMEQTSVVNIFQSGNHPISKHQHGLQAELARTLSEQAFQRLPEQVDD